MTIPPETVRLICWDLTTAVFAGTVAAYLVVRVIEDIWRRK